MSDVHVAVDISPPAGDPDRQGRRPGSGRSRGEAWVWLTGLGLATGLIMVLLLLTVVVVEGFGVFWPKRVEVFTVAVADGPEAATVEMAGEQVQRRSRRDLTRGREIAEIQIFAGNKEVYKETNFRFIDEERIRGRRQPAGMMVIERMENGDAIGMPVSLAVKGRGEIAADAPGFAGELETLVDDAVARRAELLELEKGRIAAINRRIESLTLRRMRPSIQSQADELARIDAALAEERRAFEVLNAQAKELRSRQGDHVLTLAMVGGGSLAVPLGNVVSWYLPNDLGVSGRAGLFLHNLWSFVWENPREANSEGGIFPAIFGTFVMTLLMSMAVMPFGVLAAIYLREYARQGPLVRAVRIAVNNLAGVPSIVFGVFGLGFFVYFLGGGIDSLFFAERQEVNKATFGTGGIFWAALTLALMTVPVVIVATEEAIAAVPRGMREGSLATGASKWQTMQRIVLPASAPGILTGLILAMARGAGEVAPLMLVGVVKLAPGLPLDPIWKDTDVIPFVHLDQKFMHLGFHIYDLGFQSPDSEAAKPMVFATTLFLIGLVVVLNLGAIVIRERLRRRYKTSAF